MNIPSLHMPVVIPPFRRKKTKTINSTANKDSNNKKTSRKHPKWFYGIILLLLILIGISTAFYLRDYFAAIRVPAETRVNQAITNSIEAPSYRFTIDSQLLVDGKKRQFSLIQGEKGENNSYHIQGTILGTPVNIYQIRDTTYRQDPIDHKWMVIEKSSMEKESMLISELNPISNFYFNEIGPITPLEKEKNKEENQLGMKYQIQPELENHWIEAYFIDITYQLYITKKAPYHLEKAYIEASSRSNPENKLFMEIEFWDFGKSISIQQPVLK